MKILALDASTMIGSVALLSAGKLLSEERSENQRTHSEFLNQSIESVLSKNNCAISDIDIFAVGIGPGSFTGIRVALNAAKALSYSFSKPIADMTSLEILASQTTEDCIAIINAYKNMIYFAEFKNGVLVGSTSAIEAVALEARLQALGYGPTNPILTIGDGYLAYENTFSASLRRTLHRASELSDYPLASLLARAVYEKKNIATTKDWKSVLPLYIRASAAEENLKK